MANPQRAIGRLGYSQNQKPCNWRRAINFPVQQTPEHGGLLVVDNLRCGIFGGGDSWGQLEYPYISEVNFGAFRFEADVAFLD